MRRTVIAIAVGTLAAGLFSNTAPALAGEEPRPIVMELCTVTQRLITGNVTVPSPAPAPDEPPDLPAPAPEAQHHPLLAAACEGNSVTVTTP